jgi:hypothetical protein
MGLIILARNIASYYKGVQPDGSFPSWDILKNIYDIAMASPPDWTTQNGANLAALQAGKWMRKDGKAGGTLDQSEGMAWCGIFQTYLLRCNGVNVLWRSFVGIDPLKGNLEKLMAFGNRDRIAPGDICVKGENQHHFLVHRRDGNTLYSYDGNLDIPNRQWIAERTTPVDQVHTILSPTFS